MPLVRREDFQGNAGNVFKGSPGSYGSAGGGQAASFSDYYEQVKSRLAQDEEKEQGLPSQDKELDPVNRLFANLYQGAENIRDIGGINTAFAQKEMGPEKLLAFAPTLPLGFLGSAPAAASSAWEAASGNDIQNVDLETGTMSSQKLDAGQRLGAGVNALIEGAGTFVGGSGRALGALGRGIGKAVPEAKGALDAVMPAAGKGLINKAFKDDSRIGAAVGQTVFDIGEEAGEEFVQAYAQNARSYEKDDDIFQHALESAGWGALGGAAMSGGAAGVNWAVDKVTGNDLASQLDNTSTTSDQTNNDSKPPKFTSPTEVRLTDWAKEYRGEKAFSKNKVDGAFGTVVVPGLHGQRINETMVGTDDFRAMWDAQGEDGHKWWTDQLQCTDDDIVDALSKDTAQERADAMNGLMERAGGKVTVAVERNPGTSRTSVFKSDLVGFHGGSGMMLSSLVSQLSGGDIDGDNRFIMDDRGKNALYATQLFSNPAGYGEGSLEYMPYLNTDTARKRMGEIADEYFGNVFKSTRNGKSLRDDLISNLSMSRKGGKKGIKEAAAQNLTRLREMILETKDDQGRTYDDQYADDSISSFLVDLLQLPSEKEVLASIIEEGGNRARRAIDGMVNEMMTSVGKEQSDLKIREGDPEGIRDAGEMRAWLGQMFAPSLQTGGEYLREAGVDKFMYGKRFDILKNNLGRIGAFDANNIRAEFACLLRLTDIGEDVQTSIAGQFKAEIAVRMQDELGIGSNPDNRIGKKLSPRDFKETYQKVYNEIRQKYNDALTGLSTDNEIVPLLGLIPKNKMDFEDKYDDSMLTMFKMLEDENISDYVSLSEDDQYHGLTFRQAAVLMTENGVTSVPFSGLIGDDSGEGGAFVRALLNVRETEANAISNRALASMDNLGRLTLEEAKDPQNFVQAEHMIDAFANLVGYDAANAMGIQTLESTINGPYASIILSGTGEQRVNLAISKNREYYYRDLIRMIERSAAEDSNITKEDLFHAACMLRDGSRLGDIIADQVSKTGDAEILRAYIDPSIPLSEKLEAYELQNDTRRKGSNGLIAECLRTDSTELSLSAVSQRLVRVSQFSKLAEDLSFSNVKQQATDFKNYVNTLTDHQRHNLIDRLQEYFVERGGEVNMKVTAAMAGDALRFSLQNSEKGTNPDSSSGVYNQLANHFVGGNYSFMKQILSNDLQDMEVEDLVTNRLVLIDILFNGKTVTAFDGSTETRIDAQEMLDQFFGEGSEQVDNDGRINESQFMRMIEISPTLLNILCGDTVCSLPSTNAVFTVANETTPAEGFRSFMESGSNKAEANQERFERNAIRWELQRTRGYYLALGAMCDLSKGRSQDIVQREIYKRTEQLIDHVMAKAKTLRVSDSDVGDHDLASRLFESRTREEYYSGVVDDVRDAIQEALAKSNIVMNGRDDTSPEMASAIVGPGTLLFQTGLDNIVLEAAKRYEAQGKDTEPLFDLYEEFQKVEYGKVFSDMIGGEEQARRCSAEIISLMGTEAYKRYAEKWVENFLIGRGTAFDQTDIDQIKPIFADIVDRAFAEVKKKISYAGSTVMFDYECFDFDDATGKVRRVKTREMIDQATRICAEYEDNDHVKSEEAVKEINENAAIYNDPSITDPEKKAEALKNLESLRIKLVNMALSNDLRSIGVFNSVGVNFDAFMDADLIHAEMNDFIREIAEDRESYPLASAKDEKDVEKVVLHTGRISNSYMAMGAMSAAVTSPIVTGVGTNGMELNSLLGLAVVRHDLECTDKGEEMTIAKAISEGLNGSGYTFDILDTAADKSKRRRAMTSALRLEDFDPETRIRVYNGTCRCPFCIKHSQTINAVGFDTSVDAFETMTDQLDNSQESAFLKLKKSVLDRTRKKLIRPRMSDSPITVLELHPKPTDSSDSIAMMVEQTILNLRDELSSYIATSFNSIGDDMIPTTKEDAEHLSEMMAYTARIEYVDENGDDRTGCFSLQDLVTEDGSYMMPADIKYTSIKSITPQITSPHKLNRKIMSDIAKAGRKRRITIKDMQDIATSSVMDWSDYGKEKINLLAYMQAAPAKKLAFPTKMIPCDEQTAAQKFLNGIGKGGEFKGFSDMESNLADRSPSDDPTIISDCDKLTDGTIESIGAVITRVDIPSGYKDMAKNRELQTYKTNHLSGGIKDFRISGKKAACLKEISMNQVDQLFKNVADDAWRYDYILVPMESVSERHSHQVMDNEHIVKIEDRKYSVIETFATRSLFYANSDTPQYSVTARSPLDYILMLGEGEKGGVLSLGDSAAAMCNGFANDPRRVRDDDHPFEIPIDPGVGVREVRTDMLRRDEYSEIKKALDNGERTVQLHIPDADITGIHRDNMRQKVLDLLAEGAGDASIMDATGRFKKATIGTGDLFGIARKVDGNITHLYPLSLYGKQPKHGVTITNVIPIGNKVKVEKHATVSQSEEDTIKYYLDEEATKMETRILRPEEEKLAHHPYGFPDDFTGWGVYDHLSRSGRLGNRGENSWTKTCWCFERVFPSSLRGKWNEGKFSKWANKETIIPGMKNRDALFESNSNEAWRVLAEGKTVLFGDSIEDKRYKDLNNAIRRLSVNALCGNGVELSTLLESCFKRDGDYDSKGRDYDEATGILSVLSKREKKALFNAMNPDIVSLDPDNPGMVRDDGYVLSVAPDEAGTLEYVPGYFGPSNQNDKPSNIGQGTGEAAYGKQLRIKNAFRHGMAKQDGKMFLDAIMSANGHAVRWDAAESKKFQRMLREGVDAHYSVTQNLDIDRVNLGWGNLNCRSRLIDEVYNTEDTYTKIHLQVMDGDDPVDIKKDVRFRMLRDHLDAAMKNKNPLTDTQFFAILKNSMGWSYSGGDGTNKVSLRRCEKAINEAIAAIGEGRYFLKGGAFDRDRVRVALLPKDLMVAIYNNSIALQEQYDSFSDMKKAADEEMRGTLEAIESIKWVSKGFKGIHQQKQKSALMIMVMYAQHTHGDKLDANQLFATGSLTDFREAQNLVLASALSPEEKSFVIEQQRQVNDAQARADRYRQKAISRNQYRITAPLANAGYVNAVKNDDSTIATKVLRNMESAIRLCSVANPFLIPANAFESMGHTLIAKAGLNLPWGPYSQKSIIDDGIAASIAQDDQALKFFIALNEAKLMGITDELLRGFNDADDKGEFLDALYAGKTKFDKFSDKLFKLTSGSYMFYKTQFEIFIQRFSQMALVNNVVEQTAELQDGVSRMQALITNDPSRWMVDCLAEDSPSRITFLQSLNWAAGPAMARENIMSLMLNELFRRSSVASFANAAFLSPFYRYASNFTGRVLNWVMPISSINYVLVEKLAGIPSLEHLGLEQAQVHADLKSAVIADAMHLTIPTLALLLATGLGAALQPPEDEDKIIDYREWTWFGLRIAPEWWISDALGPAMPMACTLKTFLDGKPRMDILINGLGTILMNNPLMKVGDVVDMLLEPDVFAEGWQEEKDRYMWAPGEEPSISEKILMTAEQCGLNVLGRMITPSFFKQIQQDFQKYEKSYKRVYVAGVSDIDAENEQTAETQRVDYHEAMIRQCTRRNPMLGFLMDCIKHPETSYMAMGNTILDIQGMPNVVYDDPIQRYIMDLYSIYDRDEKGNRIEKSDSEKQKVAMDIIATLEAYDDMQELYEKGFMLDSDTKAYVSDIIWQIVEVKNQEFYKWYNSAESDPYILGNGDYWTGREIRQQAYEAHDQDVSYLQQTLYYDKLWSDELKQGKQQYFRINTPYRTDANGDFYASGFPMSSNNPTGFAIADGNLGDPEGTAGAAGDWGTISKVTGTNTGERGLVAINQDYEETPDFDSWAENHGGSSGSSKGNSASGTTSGGSGYSRRRGGGGGGGGGYSPNLYSRVSPPNMSSPRQSSSSRLYTTQFDYLRPGFETKGSREANRRSDF